MRGIVNILKHNLMKNCENTEGGAKALFKNSRKKSKIQLTLGFFQSEKVKHN